MGIKQVVYIYIVVVEIGVVYGGEREVGLLQVCFGQIDVWQVMIGQVGLKQIVVDIVLV